MHVSRYGSGPRVVLVHGSITNSVTWRPVLPLARRYELVVPDRPGYPPNPPLARIDFDEQAHELAALLEGGAHLAGFSYGGVIALLAADLEPDAVRSLTVIEPPCFGVAPGHPAVEETVERFVALWTSGVRGPGEFAAGFAAVFGEQGRVPADVPPGREQGVRALMAERPPWEAEIPLARLATTRYPKLVCSSGGHPAYEAVCDVLERRLGAQRVVLAGAGHAVHHAPGFTEAFAAVLERGELAARP
ncbi:MAG: alpha/beta fold hydrolase [Actinomycetota bacterium]|nr:alpha/beta fold hydrolase [Actinomycetota bacterium]